MRGTLLPVLNEEGGVRNVVGALPRGANEDAVRDGDENRAPGVDDPGSKLRAG
jgi:hypothetical protein